MDLVVLHWVTHEEKVVSETTTLGRVWPGVLPVQIVGFFVHQYICKGLIIMLNFLHGDNHQEKLASDATTFSWMWLLTKPNCRILWSTLSLEKIKLYLSFYVWSYGHQWKLASETTSLGWVWLGLRLVQTDCRILWLSVSLERIIDFLVFLCMELALKGKVASKTTLFGWMCPVVPGDNLEITGRDQKLLKRALAHEIYLKI